MKKRRRINEKQRRNKPMSETENRPLDEQELPTPEEAAALAAEAMMAEEG